MIATINAAKTEIPDTAKIGDELVLTIHVAVTEITQHSIDVTRIGDRRSYVPGEQAAQLTITEIQHD